MSDLLAGRLSVLTSNHYDAVARVLKPANFHVRVLESLGAGELRPKPCVHREIANARVVAIGVGPRHTAVKSLS